MTGSPPPDFAEPPLRLLGAPRLHTAAGVVQWWPERRFQLLALLALRSGQWVARDEVAALLWPDRSNADARRNLRHVVFKAREVCGGAPLEATEHALRWDVDSDLRRFAEALARRDPAGALRWRRGPLLDGLESAAAAEFADWLRAERRRLDQDWHRCAVLQLAALTPAMPARAALAEQMLALDACDEVAVSALIEGELAAGRAAHAERRFREFAARLAEQLGVEPSQRLRELVRSSAMTAAPADARAFIGRQSELSALARLLAPGAAGVVVLLGPGGVGKSQLARQALAAQARPSVWVELQDLREIGSVVSRLADRLGVELPERADPIDVLGPALTEAPRLLVLDNAEHLAELPAFVSRLRLAVPSLCVFLTSRRRLHIDGESLLVVTGLAVPDDDSRDLEAASTFDAVRLFDARARALQRGFELARHLDAVTEIVDAVGGSPLAIELAASWLRLLPPAAIARDLRQSIAVLAREGADDAARPEHASMRAVLDASWALLAPSERDAMVALSVFHGGFTHAAARDVADVALPVLSSLVDKCVLQVDEAGRFGMHALIAADALAQAAREPRRAQAAADRHAAHYARELAALAAAHGDEPRQAARAMQAEGSNLERAWHHAIERRRPDWLGAMLPAWRSFFVASGRYGQGVAHFERALACDAEPSLAARLRATLAYCLVRDRKPEGALALAHQGLELATRAGDAATVQECNATIGGCKLILGQWEEAREWVGRSLQLARERGTRREMATEMANLGLIATFLGRYDEAVDSYRQAVETQRQLGNSVSAARALCNLGFAHVARADWPLAQDTLEQARRYAAEHGVHGVALEAQFLLGTVLIERDHVDDAERHLQQARAGFAANCNPGFVLKCDCYLARIAARRGAAAEAARTLLQALRTARAHAWSYDVLYAAIYMGELLAVRGQRSEAAQLLHSLRTAPHAHAFVRSLIDAMLTQWTEAGASAARPPFEATLDALVGSAGLDDAAVRLRALRSTG